MKNKLLAMFVIVAVMISMTGVTAAVDDKEDHKILICHVPPGNPDNPQQIEVDQHAWENGHSPHNAHALDFVIGDGNGKVCGNPPAPVPELSPMILTSAGLLGLLGIVQVSRKLRK